jgi:3-phosphoshikimate 1-carboxyvinyltransferase
MNYVSISKKDKTIKGAITLTGSKSICNRALLIRALSGEDFPIYKIAAAQDTQTLIELLESNTIVRDAGPAGTTYRFMTAFLALQEGEQTLTGSERMKQRPIKILVDALRSLGANIEYLENDGFPPLKIGTPNSDIGKNNEISIPAGVSSQYISALLMIAPNLPNGLKLTLTGDIVSLPYIQMTLNLMAYFGVTHRWEAQTIIIEAQNYEAKPFTVEADWSAASYYYSLAAFAENCDLQLNGLFENSIQGDAALVKMTEHFGVKTTFNEAGVHLSKVAEKKTEFVYDFLECPDLAQAIAVICGGLGIKGHFSGLKTLKIKETDRVAALYNELKKVGVAFEEQTDGSCKISKKASSPTLPSSFATYEDHRMAMAFAPISMLVGAIQIEEPMVVGKSYPDFWKDFEALGFECVFS